jgi:hypothetical protein
LICAELFPQKKGRKLLLVYLRLLRISAAATAIMMMTAAPMATNVVIGVALVGGMTTGLRVGAMVAVGAAVGVIAVVGV